MQIHVMDGSTIDLHDAATALDLAEKISSRLAQKACAAEVNGELKDLRTTLHEGDTVKILTFEDEGGRWAYRHTCAHILGQAVQRLYPKAKLAIGPAIDEGFYYDIDVDHTFSEEDLKAIEAEAHEIIKANYPIEFSLPSHEEALQKLKDQEASYKLEMVEEWGDDAVLSFYTQGEFTDLCAGPHLMHTGDVKAFKLLQVSGAYWRGDEHNKMLQRIYGTAFPSKKELDDYLTMREEAKARDHNKIGRELGYFTTSEIIGQGLPLLLPNGAKLFQILQRYVEDLEYKWGYVVTKTPYMAKSDLYKISGHWDHYRNAMFVLGEIDEDGESVDGSEVMALRPMTCPFQYQCYLTKMHSYRDLPVRMSETSTLFRNEASGEMHGLIRVRQFTLSDAHIICTPDQLEDEFLSAVQLGRIILKDLGLDGDVFYEFSRCDPDHMEDYVGSKEQWETMEAMMAKILTDNHIEYTDGIGDAAFYGPKLDIQIKNVFGKPDTLVTVQIDMTLAKNFGLEYVDENGEKQTPYIVHRSSIGCYERTIALLLEKYAGAFPLWLAPEQVRILPISDKHVEAAFELRNRLRQAGLRCEVDQKSEKIGKKIKLTQNDKIPYMLILGDKEVESQTVAVRQRQLGDLGTMTVDAFLDRAKKENDEKLLEPEAKPEA